MNFKNNIESQSQTTTITKTPTVFTVRKIVFGSVVVLTLAALSLYTFLNSSSKIDTPTAASTVSSGKIVNTTTTSPSDSRAKLVFLAQIAEKAKRFDDVILYMNDVSKMEEELSTDERELLFIGYMNAINSLRNSWHTISALEKDAERNIITPAIEIISEYRANIEKEFARICEDFLNILDEHLIPSTTTTSSEAMIIYRKKKGDLLRYLAELSITGRREDVVSQAKEAYESALQLAYENLSAIDPIRLGLILNYTVLIFENLLSPKEAYRLASGALADASHEINTRAGETEISENTNILIELLKGNMNLWAAAMHNGNEPKDNRMFI